MTRMLAVSGFIALCLLAACQDKRAPAPESSPSAIEEGHARLLANDAEGAVRAFKRAHEADPRDVTLRLNLALAALRAKDYELAADTIGDHWQRDDLRSDLRTRAAYLRGMALRELGKPGDARAPLEAARSADPGDIQVRYQLALAYADDGAIDSARTTLESVLSSDAFHLGAHFQMSRIERQARRTDLARTWQIKYERLLAVLGEERLRKENWGDNRYTRPLRSPAASSPAAGMVAFKLVRNSREAAAPWPVSLAPGSSDFDLCSVAASTKGVVLRTADESKGAGQEPATAQDARALGSVIGDLDNEGTLDIVTFDDRTLSILEHAADGKFTDATSASGIVDANAIDVRLVDDDHDGDLDIWTVTNSGTLRVWRGDGQGGFVDDTDNLSFPESLLEELRPVRRLDAAEVNDDDAIDILLAGKGGVAILFNAGAGSFSAGDLMPWKLQCDGIAVTAEDFDGDGHIEGAFLVIRDGRRSIVFSNPDFAEIPLPAADTSDLVAGDLDGDGFTDLAIAETGTLRFLRQTPGRNFEDQTASSVTNDGVGAGRLLVSDVDDDGDLDVLTLSRSARAILYENIRPAKAAFVRLSLEGTRSNRSGIGARIDLWQKGKRLRRMVRSSRLTIPLIEHAPVETVSVVWTNGVTDAKRDVADGARVKLVEPLVALGSCPYLYVRRNGRFEFVTDILGNSPLGLALDRQRVLPADTDELCALPEGIADESTLTLRVTDELREVLYLDHVSLLVVDHDPDIEIHSNDALRPPPFPPSTLIAVRSPEPPTSAIDDKGRDVTALLASSDGQKWGPSELAKPQLRGLAQPHSVDLSFPHLDQREAPVLVLEGWLQYGDASVNVATSQDPNAKSPFPTLAAVDAKGHVTPIPVIVGAPAGKTKTIVVELAGLIPPRTVSLRLASSSEIWWDRIALGERAPLPEVRTLAPHSSKFFHRGVSRMSRSRPIDPLVPIHDDLVDAPPWSGGISGPATRHGDVSALIHSIDDCYIIFVTGDAADFDFDLSPLPPRPPSQKRSAFAFFDGWDKDADHNVRTGRTTTPWPLHSQNDQHYGLDLPSALPDWHLDYTTRIIAPER